MYRHILIPTDGSELAEHAVTNGLSLAKSVGAKVTVIIVEEVFNLQPLAEALQTFVILQTGRFNLWHLYFRELHINGRLARMQYH